MTRLRGRVAAARRRDARTLINGNFQTYTKDPYSAHTSMWGLNQPARTQLVAASAMRVDPTPFPANTTFEWNVTPDPGHGGPNGYLHADYGNYDWSPGVITPAQVKSITALTLNVSWSYAGDGSSGLLTECYLSAAAHPSGQFTKLAEVAFFPRNSPAVITWLQTLPNLGTFTDASGVTWQVREAVILNSTAPYLIAYRPDYGDHQGNFHFKDLFTFLVGLGKINADWYMNGVAFGVEPHSGAGSLTINSMVPTYTVGAPPAPPAERIVNGDFAAAEANWAGFWYSGKDPMNGRANFTSSPAYDGIDQPVTLVAGKYYELRYTISNYAAGNFFGQLSGGSITSDGTIRSANGTFTQRLLANAGNNRIYLMPHGSGFTGAIDNVSLIGPYDTATVGGA